MSPQVQLMQKVEVKDAELKLCIIVRDVLDAFRPAEAFVRAVQKPQRALELYDAIILWQDSLPVHMRRETAGHPSTIMLQSVHVYHYCLLCPSLMLFNSVFAEYMLIVILRPFGHLPKADFGRFAPKERCHSHASRLMATIWAYRAIAMSESDVWLIIPISTAALLVLQDLDPGSAELTTLLQACQCLYEMSKKLPVTIDCLAEVYKAFQWSPYQLPANIVRFFVEVQQRLNGGIHQTIPSLTETQTAFNSKNRTNTAFVSYFQELLMAMESTTLD